MEELLDPWSFVNGHDNIFFPHHLHGTHCSHTSGRSLIYFSLLTSYINFPQFENFPGKILKICNIYDTTFGTRPAALSADASCFGHMN